MPTPTLRTILVATTLSPDSDTVVALAARWAAAAGARLHVLHAMLLPIEYDDLPASGPLAPDAYAALETTLRARLDAQLARLAIGADVLGAAEIVDGTPWRVIRARAAEIHADVIVVGATDSDGLFDRLMGSTASHVLAGADRPVLVVRGRADGAPARVLAPVDLSPLAGQAFAAGCALVAAAAGQAGATVTALFVLDERQRGAGIQFSPEQMDRFAADELDRFTGTYAPSAPGLTLRNTVRVGEPREAILAAAEEGAADLVLIGTHGYTGWDRRVFGSVAADVMLRCPCSVLILPATGATDPPAPQAQPRPA
jgi:nucleotide-binding universal stress UspA family protein